MRITWHKKSETQEKKRMSGKMREIFPIREEPNLTIVVKIELFID